MAASTAAEENRALVRRFFEVQEEKDLDGLEEVLSSGYPLHGIPGAEENLPGVDAVEACIRGLLDAFPDMTATIEALVAGDDSVAYRACFAGTHEGKFMDIPATGERVTVDAPGFLRMEDGKLAKVWPEMNRLGLLQQPGMAEVPGE